jgi:hypothetical protein
MTSQIVHILLEKNHPNHNGHVKIHLSKMMEWSFWPMFKLDSFLLDLLIKKPFFFDSMLIKYHLF